MPKEIKNKKKTQSSIALEVLRDSMLHSPRKTRRTKAPLDLSQGENKNIHNPIRTRREAPLGGGRRGASLLLKYLFFLFFFFKPRLKNGALEIK
jgi:hypothetical protein